MIRIGRALLAAVFCIAAAPAFALKPGDVPPPLAAPSESGDILGLQNYRGQVVYIDFWASWCAPCREAMPQYDRLYRQWRGRGLTILGVNVDTDRKAAQRALKRTPVSFPVIYDPTGQWPERFDLPTMPSGYLIDRKGRVRHVHAGFRSGDLPALEALIDAALKESP